MKAILLVAGYATRLYPLTLNQPKALLPIKGKPILDYLVDGILEIPEVDKIYIVSNDKFYNHFADWAKDRPILKVINDGTTTEDNRRGAIGDILYAIEQENIDDEAIVSVGDNYFTYSIKDYYDFYKKTQTDCINGKVIDDPELLKRLAVASLDDNGKVLELVEKPEHPKSNIGVYGTYFYKKDTIPLFRQYIDEGNKPDAPGYFVQWLYRRKDVHAYIIDGECYDIGTAESYEEVQHL